MISFFRAFDPVRLIVLLVIMLAIKIPMLVKGVPLLNAEIGWMLIGEKMASNAILYKDIWVQLEPLSGGVYYILNSLFGKSQLAFQIFSLLLIFIQASSLNIILNNNNVYNERTSIPAILYILSCSVFFDLNTVPPALLGMNFILIAFNYLLIQVRVKTSIEIILIIGVCTGIASLFYLSFVFFLFALVIILLISLFPPPKLYFTLFTGFLIPYLIIFCYYFLIDGLDDLYVHLFVPFLQMVHNRYISLLNFFSISAPLLLLSIASILMLQKSKYVNFQYQVVKITIVWGIFAGISACLIKNLEPFHLFLIIPPAIILSTHFFLLVKNFWIKELTFWSLAVVIIGFNYFSLYKSEFFNSYIPLNEITVKKTGSYKQYKNLKVIVLSDNKEPYLNNKLATPYYSWVLSQSELTTLSDYNHLSHIYKRFSKDMPDVIVDDYKVIPKIFIRLPVLKAEYNKVTGTNIYLRKESFNILE